MTLRSLPLHALAAALIGVAGAAHAAVVVSEVDPTGSGNGTYAADWFELTNTGTSAVAIAGWTMDDDSAKFSKSVALTGVTRIAAGQSVVFIEDTSAADATVDAAFEAAWFGAKVPSSLVIGNYGGSGVGLSSGGDAVNIFDASGTLVTGVTFGASTSGVSFDNAAGLSGAISTLSVAGVDGAFVSTTGEIGSPGTVASAVPEPASVALMLAGMSALGFMAIRRRDGR